MIPFYSSSQGKALEERINNLETKGSGKIWHELDLTQAQLSEIEHNGQLVVNLPTAYDPTNFANDYIKAIVNFSGEYIGNLVSCLSPLNKLYIDFVHKDDWCNSSVKESLVGICANYGFNQENYAMGYIYSQTNAAGRSYIKINSNEEYLSSGYEGLQTRGLLTVGTVTGTWQSSDTCPIRIQEGEEFLDGDVWTGWALESKDFYLVYKVAGGQYKYSEITTGETANTAILYGDNFDHWSKNGLEEAIQVHPNYIDENPLDGYNMVYIADVTAQEWDNLNSNVAQVQVANEFAKEPIPLVEQEYGKQFALNIHGKNTKISYLMVLEDNRMSKIDSSTHQITEWADTEAGEVYHLTWDATARRYSLGAALTDAEKETLFSTGIEFDSVSGASEVISYDEEQDVENWWCSVAGDNYPALEYVFSADEPFEEPTESQQVGYIARPLGLQLRTIKYADPETGKYISSTGGTYIWSINMGYGAIIAEISTRDLSRMIIELNETSSSSFLLHRHTLRIEPAEGALFETGEVVPHLVFLAVNAQYGSPTPEYLLNSDVENGWALPVSGAITIKGSPDTHFHAIAIKTKYVNIGGTDTWALTVAYIDNNWEKQEAVLFTQSNLHKYTVADIDSPITITL